MKPYLNANNGKTQLEKMSDGADDWNNKKEKEKNDKKKQEKDEKLWRLVHSLKMPHLTHQEKFKFVSRKFK